MIRTAILAALALSAPAMAHDAMPTAAQPLGWTYPWQCCSGNDCRRADGEVAERPEGFVIAETGEVVPYGDKRIKNSPDQDFHVCAHRAGLDAGKVICLFVPARGF